jgi:hypothetical protein
MKRETYKGRKLIVKIGHGRDYGFRFTYVNGQLIGQTSQTPERALAQLRRDVDAADTRPEAYAEYWFN